MSAVQPGVMFSYWGRRGALSQLALEVGRTAVAQQDIAATMSVSRQNEIFPAFCELGPALFPVDTFARNTGIITDAWRIPPLRRHLVEKIRSDGIKTVIELMPHVWSPFIMPAVRTAGARYVTIIHDADAHPGDGTSWAKLITDRSMRSADVVVTLSQSVAAKIIAAGRASPDKVRTLFHPDLSYAGARQRTAPADGRPWRLLFLGRIMPYKGLALCLETVELLRREGLPVELGVFGEGPLGDSAERLQRLGAEVVNRWLSTEEIAAALQRYDAAVLSYIEASQSGVAAAAYGAGMPVIATPVGGLCEQVQDGVTGVVATRVDAGALADATKRLFDPEGYSRMCANIQRASDARSMARFVREIVALGLAPGEKPI
ncbi:MAG: glycosyltransferase family 4 protein [Hyphomicrobium sp.]